MHFAGHKENFANPSLVHFSFCLILEAFLISLNFLTLINAIRILILVFDITFSVFPSRVELETKVHPKVRNHGEGPY